MDTQSPLQLLEAKREENLGSIRAKRQQKAEHLRQAEAIDKEISTFQKMADEYTAAVKALKATQGNAALVDTSAHDVLMEQLRASASMTADEFFGPNEKIAKPRRGRPAKGEGKFDAKATP